MIAVAKGEKLTKNHPFLEIMTDTLAIWQRKSQKGEVIEVKEIEDFTARAIDALSDSWVPHDTRFRAISELLQYIYPKRRSVDQNVHGSVQMDISVKPLTRTEIEGFAKVLDEKY